jgi:hypothetical protein
MLVHAIGDDHHRLPDVLCRSHVAEHRRERIVKRRTAMSRRSVRWRLQTLLGGELLEGPISSVNRHQEISSSGRLPRMREASRACARSVLPKSMLLLESIKMARLIGSDSASKNAMFSGWPASRSVKRKPSGRAPASLVCRQLERRSIGDCCRPWRRAPAIGPVPLASIQLEYRQERQPCRADSTRKNDLVSGRRRPECRIAPSTDRPWPSAHRVYPLLRVVLRPAPR